MHLARHNTCKTQMTKVLSFLIDQFQKLSKLNELAIVVHFIEGVEPKISVELYVEMKCKVLKFRESVNEFI